jgi:hypothetical protein
MRNIVLMPDKHALFKNTGIAIVTFVGGALQLVALTLIIFGGLAHAEDLKELKLYEVGRFGELSARPNPQNYVVLTVPDIDTLIPVLVKERGKRFTPEEVKEMRNNAASIVLTSSEAENMRQARERRR